jgi:hypothetical protein
MNENGDWAVIWDVDDPAGNLEALIFNGEVLLRETDEVDFDGDGVVDPGATLDNFTGISTLVVGDRGPTGIVSVYFTADVTVPGSSDELEVLYRIDVPTAEAVQLPLDIKPGSCPNPYNTKSNGVLPVSVVGTMDFDLMEVDLSTLTISRADGVGGSVAPIFGPPGPQPSYEDNATPFVGDPCDCHDAMGDGIIDLALKFYRPELTTVLELPLVENGSEVELVVSGVFLDGTAFEAADCIVVKGNPYVPPQSTASDALTEDQLHGMDASDPGKPPEPGFGPQGQSPERPDSGTITRRPHPRPDRRIERRSADRVRQ